MRAFIAINVSSEVVDALTQAQQMLKGARMTLPKEFHCTLKFLGEITDEQLADVKARLKAIKSVPLTLSLDVVGAFPHWKLPKVIWAGLAPAPQVVALQRQVDAALALLFPESEAFIPHVTLARVKEIADIAAVQTARQLQLPKMLFTVDKLVLYKSELGKEGPKYEELLVVPLV
jgi:2'-5' RNA ligase